MQNAPMTLEQARQVLWLRKDPHYYRPMGELFDEGYLNTGRLTWAVKNAYDNNIKKAATVLLNEQKQNVQSKRSPTTYTTELPKLSTSLSVERARTTLWPFSPFRGQQMGALSDAREITLKDLGYAVENAWNEQVRQAAIVLSALRLEQAVKETPTQTGPANIVSTGESYSQKKHSTWTFLKGILAGTGLILWCLAVLRTVRRFINGQFDLAIPQSIPSLIGVLLGLGTGWLIVRLFFSFYNKIEGIIENHRQGWEGEERVVENLRQHLDNHWTIIRNLSIPGRNRADIDIILVGPPGVWALEVKNYTGAYRNFGEHWEYLGGKKPRSLKKTPSRQAQNNAVRLASFLKADKIQQWVTPVVVWANPESELTVEQPLVPVWEITRLSDELGNLWQNKTMDTQHQQRIIDKLTALSEKQQERNES